MARIGDLNFLDGQHAARTDCESQGAECKEGDDYEGSDLHFDPPKVGDRPTNTNRTKASIAPSFPSESVDISVISCATRLARNDQRFEEDSRLVGAIHVSPTHPKVYRVHSILSRENRRGRTPRLHSDRMLVRRRSTILSSSMSWERHAHAPERLLGRSIFTLAAVNSSVLSRDG